MQDSIAAILEEHQGSTHSQRNVPGSSHANRAVACVVRKLCRCHRTA